MDTRRINHELPDLSYPPILNAWVNGELLDFPSSTCAPPNIMQANIKAWRKANEIMEKLTAKK